MPFELKTAGDTVCRCVTGLILQPVRDFSFAFGDDMTSVGLVTCQVCFGVKFK